MTILALILTWLLFGFIVGLIARAIYPGTQSMGFLQTAGVGIAGSFAGGLIGNVLAGVPVLTLHGAGLIGSIAGALLVMAILGYRARPADA